MIHFRFRFNWPVMSDLKRQCHTQCLADSRHVVEAAQLFSNGTVEDCREIVGHDDRISLQPSIYGLLRTKRDENSTGMAASGEVAGNHREHYLRKTCRQIVR